MNSQQNKIDSSGVDAVFLKKEIARLRNQEDRYNKAYGSGLFTMEQLKEYTVPVREKVASYESQILKSEQGERELRSTPLPNKQEVEVFAKEACKVLQDLNFGVKRAIVKNVVERVVGTHEKLQIYGFIPVTNVNVCTNDRHRQNTPRHVFDENSPKVIPFSFEVNIPLLTVGNIQKLVIQHK
jgi:site-specific DNA recombinase